jgi:DNA polymerase III subunit alpha
MNKMTLPLQLLLIRLKYFFLSRMEPPKKDFPSLVSKQCETLIKTGSHQDVGMDSLDYTDAATWQAVRKMETTGLCGLETDWAKKLISSIQPEQLRDLVAVITLARPRPLDMGLHILFENNKNNPENTAYILPDVKPVLQDFFGVILFDEQILEIASTIAGFHDEKARKLLKVLKSKNQIKIQACKQKFISGAQTRSYDREKSAALFDELAKHAPCCMNKAGLVSAASVLYYCAYLKTHYAPAYMAAAMTVEREDHARLSVLICECRRLNITLLPPDINASEMHFSIKDDAVVFGLSAVRNVKEAFIKKIIQERVSGGSYKNLDDFKNRVSVAGEGTEAFASLMACGAFDKICNTGKKTV